MLVMNLDYSHLSKSLHVTTPVMEKLESSQFQLIKATTSPISIKKTNLLYTMPMTAPNPAKPATPMATPKTNKPNTNVSAANQATISPKSTLPSAKAANNGMEKVV